ncbi:2Fe-2S iron-sulfur cluster-binding protein [Candidatus Bandiella euplotis]|uniref:Adrenodoxin-like protein n=1 Tax=Candidatus Bandiella euplotis TaxID=1664265 RepID=A0ABZ0ULV2_9RICK|nr:2Fe-2S iron-sulfur cluster-binding protein [Candidatus Bandiella woodruffii]WPX96927.1 Putative (2Fe-2S) ferredoxin [Candidatus Bandiella woodruffii]
MPKVNFIFDDGRVREVEAPNGLSVMEIAHKNDIFEIEGACGGSLSCATCHVVVEPQFYDLLENIMPKKEEEEDMLDLAFGLTKTSRLSCQIIMQDNLDGLTVKIPTKE